MTWRSSILREFTPELAQVSRLTVVSDPDELLLEQGLLERLRDSGFELVTHEDPVAFRFQFERRFRAAWDRDEPTNLVVVLRTPDGDVEELPFDLLHKAQKDRRVLSYNLAELFPQLVPAIVRSLDRRWFDRLWQAVAEHSPASLGDRQTRDFILRHVFEVTPEQIKTPAHLLRVLLERHYKGVTAPRPIDEHLVACLERTGRWDGWPLHEIVADRESFFSFLQERWSRFLHRQLSRREPADAAEEPKFGYGMKVHGPLDLPFEHDDVRVYVDNLFVEGLLQAVQAPDGLPDGWWKVGVKSEASESEEERFDRLRVRVDRELPAVDAAADEWLVFTPRFAEWLAVRWSIGRRLSEDRNATASSLHDAVESRFLEWLEAHYATLPSLGYLPPKMVHHVPLWIRRETGPKDKVALVVVDGLAWDQWAVVRRELGYREAPGHSMVEGAVFAWIPTLTSISRQAIFAGKAPMFFEGSIKHLDKEEEHWRNVWAESGVLGPAVGYESQGKRTWGDFMGAIRGHAEHPHRRALGIVVYTVDKTMHDLEFGHGSSGMQAMIRHWARQGELRELIDALLDNGFRVVLTADHGNVETRGIGKPNVGKSAESRGQRVHIFSDQRLRDDLHKKVAGSTRWAGPGLPETMLALFPPGRTGFWKEGPPIVAHGGPSVEEVIVPLVVIERDR